MSAWLATEEVRELTSRTRWTAQRRALKEMGIPFRPNHAGRPLVERASVLQFRGEPKRTPDEPNWGGIRNG